MQRTVCYLDVFVKTVALLKCIVGVLSLPAVTKAVCRVLWPGLSLLEWTWHGPLPWKSSCRFLCCLLALGPDCYTGACSNTHFWKFRMPRLLCHGSSACLPFLLVRIVTSMAASLSSVRCCAQWQICLCYSSL